MSEADYRFIRLFKRFGHLDWLNNYFDLLRDFFLYFKITSQVGNISLLTGKKNKYCMYIAGRPVAKPGFKMGSVILMLAPWDIDLSLYNCGFVGWHVKNGRAIAKRAEYFIGRHAQIPENLYTRWRITCLIEMKNAERKFVSKHHSPLFYAVVMHKDLRKELLNRVRNKKLNIHSGEIDEWLREQHVPGRNNMEELKASNQKNQITTK